MLFRKSYFFIVFIFNLSLVSFHFLKNLNFSGTTNYYHKPCLIKKYLTFYYMVFDRIEFYKFKIF
ncbi:hypothetical protein C5473_01885 [Leptospira interrogans serovar Weerasinghe]|nr:hypothetical protein C5473_01885 [Leptospira interrogans serovar Weerasinghe]